MQYVRHSSLATINELETEQQQLWAVRRSRHLEAREQARLAELRAELTRAWAARRRQLARTQRRRQDEH